MSVAVLSPAFRGLQLPFRDMFALTCHLNSFTGNNGRPSCADFVAGAALCEPPCADVVAGAALCEPPCADFVRRRGRRSTL